MSPKPEETKPQDPSAGRLVQYEHSRNFATLLTQQGISLLITTYQAGKLVVVGAVGGSLAMSFHNFERAMGLAVKNDRLALGTLHQIWFLRGAADLAAKMEPLGRYDGCFLARSSSFTGDIHAHEIAWAGEELWVVNTLFSCLCTLHEKYTFVPRWRPPFVSRLAAEDRCHLNGLALEDGKPRYVTVLAESDTPQGWRSVKANGGCLIDISRNEIVARDLAIGIYTSHPLSTWMR